MDGNRAVNWAGKVGVGWREPGVREQGILWKAWGILLRAMLDEAGGVIKAGQMVEEEGPEGGSLGER